MLTFLKNGVLGKFNQKPSVPVKTLQFLLIVGLVILIIGRLWQLTQIDQNLLNNPGFEQVKLTGWRVMAVNGAQARPKPAADNPGNTVLELKVPAAGAGTGVGVGQYLPVTPLQRYKLMANYRPTQATDQNLPKLLLRLSQFNQAGELIKQDEILGLEDSQDTEVTETPSAWHWLTYSFITAEQAASVEIGLGFFSNEATAVEIDDLVFQVYPTCLSAARDDSVTLSLFLLLLVIIGYKLGQILWPIKRKLIINSGLAAISLMLTLIAIEMVINFFPIQIVGNSWPHGYHVPLENGQGYRMAKNYPRTIITNRAGAANVVVSNSLGVRDLEMPSLTNNELVVLVLGDSMTFGEVGDVGDSWPRRLDEQLAEMTSGPDKFHVVNAGVSGYNTFQEVMLFQELIEDMKRQGVKPKVALVSFFSGIWERNGYGPDGAFTVMQDILLFSSFKQAILNMPTRLSEQSQYDDLKLMRIDRLQGLHQMLASKSRVYFVLSLLLTLRYDKAWREPLHVDLKPANEAALRLFKQVAEANEIQPVVVYLPGYEMFSSPASNQELVKQLSDICQDVDLTFINPYENMQKLGINADNAKEELTLMTDAHYSIMGNLTYAKAVAPLMADYLQEFQLSSSTPTLEK